MDEGADSGDILSQKEIEIDQTDDAKSLYDKIVSNALSQIEIFVPQLIKKTFEAIPQDHNLANIWRKRSKKDGKIDFRMSSKAIYNLVRALTKPYIGAHIEFDNKDVSIWKVEPLKYNHKNIESGKVLKIEENTIIVKTYDGAIKILEHDFRNLPKEGTYL